MAGETDQVTQTDGGTEGAELTLDAVYKEFNVDQVASEFNPQTRQAPIQQEQPRQETALPESVPDPLLDANGFKEYQARQALTSKNHEKLLSQLSNHMTQLRVKEVREQEERDIGAAVQKVKEAGFEADKDFIEIALGQKAKQDPRFLAVFNNRQKNPAAWNKALAAVANEMKGKFAFKTDANLADNVRAARNSTKTTQDHPGETSGSSLDKHFAGIKDPTQFSNEWQKLVNGGTY
jgi:hypothetical protein